MMIFNVIGIAAVLFIVWFVFVFLADPNKM